MKYHAIAVLQSNDINGIITFKQEIDNSIKIKYSINGLSDGFHGFHIHKCGDLSDGCISACEHYNPYNKNHGGLNSKERHLGDLGNIKSKNGICKGYLTVKDIGLDYKSKNCILGRTIIIHSDKDDLGKGGDQESIKTGNSGKRIACAVIGISKYI